jgi:hypothetical protein
LKSWISGSKFLETGRASHWIGLAIQQL